MAEKISRVNSPKINITMRRETLAKVDDYCRSMGLTRSAFLAMAAEQYLTAVSAMPSVNNLLENLAATTTGLLDGELTPLEARVKMDNSETTYNDLFNQKK